MYEANALVDAIKDKNFELAQQLVGKGEKIPKNLADFDKKQIFDALARGRAFDLINSFVKDGTIETDIYEYDKLDGSIFESLFKNLSNDKADLDFLEAFIQKLDNLNDTVQDKTLLWLAFENSAPLEVIKLLVDAGCDINYKTNYEENFLYKIIQQFAIKEEKGTQYLEYLIQEGVDINAGNIVREAPLHLAISRNKNSYAEFLLSNGADPNQPGKDDETAYYIALVHMVGGLSLYNQIKEYAPADFDIANKNGETLLIGVLRMRGSSVSEDGIQLLQALISDGADVYQTAPYYGKDKSALDWISEQPAEVLQAVLEMGVVEINKKDNEGNTLLHKICGYDVNYDQEAAKQIYRKAKLLIENGADINATNDRDKTPMDLAAQDNLKSKTVELLLKNKA